MKRTHVVTIRILNERERIVGDLVDELHTLMIGCVIDATLQDAAPVSVSGNFNTIGSHSVVDELQVNQHCSETCTIVPYLIVIRG